ncbi:MAG: class I SAM-dependent methyltransferase [Deltaproteobacteria bacterium]|nr:class I SAM-dependent methyltransferase [Deltaproteobacteria bacterium]
MSVFKHYARYYNLLYHDKNYQAEADYVEQLMQKHTATKPQTILDLGCGTGNHDLLLARHGYTVQGLDLSDDMIAVAREKSAGITNLSFRQDDICNFSLSAEFDAVISLFHVMSYQTSNQALKACLENAFTHLRRGGIFIFDFWYGPAVLTDPPAVRIKRLEDNEIRVTRLAEPVLHANDNIVDVNYEVMIEEIETAALTTLKETHRMRYLFYPELEFMLQEIGFTNLVGLEWLTHDQPLSNKSWNGVIMAAK